MLYYILIKLDLFVSIILFNAFYMLMRHAFSDKQYFLLTSVRSGAGVVFGQGVTSRPVPPEPFGIEIDVI